MDIKDLKPTKQDEGVLVHFKNADGDLEYEGEGENRKPVTAVVAGEFSERHKKISRKLTERSMKRQDMKPSAEIIESRTHEIQAACIISWDFTADGKPFPINAKNWAAILSVKPEYEKQVSSAIYAYSSFFDKPSDN